MVLENKLDISSFISKLDDLLKKAFDQGVASEDIFVMDKNNKVCSLDIVCENLDNICYIITTENESGRYTPHTYKYDSFSFFVLSMINLIEYKKIDVKFVFNRNERHLSKYNKINLFDLELKHNKELKELYAFINETESENINTDVKVFEKVEKFSYKIKSEILHRLRLSDTNMKNILLKNKKCENTHKNVKNNSEVDIKKEVLSYFEEHKEEIYKSFKNKKNYIEKGSFIGFDGMIHISQGETTPYYFEFTKNGELLVRAFIYYNAKSEGYDLEFLGTFVSTDESVPLYTSLVQKLGSHKVANILLNHLRNE